MMHFSCAPRLSPRTRAGARVVAAIVAVAWLLGPQGVAAGSQPTLRGPVMRLPGHVLPALAEATRISPSDAKSDEIRLTIVLRRSDQPGFARELRAVYDPASLRYHRFSTSAELTERFGPSREAYERLLAFLEAQGFELVAGSENRLTVSVRGTRAAAERAFDIEIGDYELGERRFYANDRDPALPAELASHVQAITGLSNLARPQAAEISISDAAALCSIAAALVGLVWWPAAIVAAFCAALPIADPFGNRKIRIRWAYGPPTVSLAGGPLRASGLARPAAVDVAPGAQVVTGAGQTIGITSFSDFDVADVRDWLALMDAEPEQIDRLSRVSLDGGAPSGPDQVEPLLDVAAVMSVARDADVVVYDAPFTGPGTSFQALFNAMIDDGVDVISNSWAYCEGDTTVADVESIDAILQTAAAAGISVLSASGDMGSTCLNGQANTVHVPSSSPNVTAVGGTTLTLGPGFTYGGETWWNGAGSVPPTGQGGFGLSRFFARPAYQDALNGESMRSLPDVAVNADPATGFILCQASAGGCPDGKLYGGTSVAAPIWAGFAALLNEARGANLGFLNPLMYPLAQTAAFHDAASMSSDFAHVGLGSPNLEVLHRLLNGIVAGVPDAAVSEAVHAGSITGGQHGFPLLSTPADGTSAAVIVVTLSDAAGHTVGGKAVQLAADSANAVIAPGGAATTDDNGQAVFAVTNLEPEVVTLTATDTTDGIVLAQTPSVTFGVPAATAAGITAFPTTVTANGVSSTTITVTLQDVLGRGTPGKEVQLSQGGGHSIISGPIPPVTDANGEIQFAATNLVNETVTYTAVDVTDGNLPVPGSVAVTFQSGAAGACGSGPPPVGVGGYTVTPFATGFEAGPFFFGGVNFQGCAGATLPAFLDGDVFISDARTGDLFKLGLDGGAAANPIANHGPTLTAETVGADGRLYALRVATTGNATTGAILELDPETGDVLRTVASNLLCPHSLVVDPLSGDLFYDDSCFGGFVDPAIHRVRDPASATPTVEVYATLPRTPNGRMAFAPDGTLYVVTGYTDAQPAVVRVSGTDGPTPPAIETISGVHSFFWVNIAEVGPGGDAKSLVVLTADGLEVVDITTDPTTRTVIAEGIGAGAIGPDGCLYSTLGHTVFKITDPAGGCSFLSTAATPTLSLTPGAVSPNPLQGAAQAFTATFHNVDAPEGTPVFFQVSGANPTVHMARTNAAGEASFAHTATFAGDDVVVATAVVDDEALTSNRARVTWDPGRHVTFLTLNPSPRAGTPGQTVEVRASLSDSSVEPPSPVEGATVDFMLGTAECSGVTDESGLAGCELTASPPGTSTLTARFAGTPQLVESSDAIGFNVIGDGPMGGPLGDFKCYVVRSKTGTPRFAKIEGVRLDDEFETLIADLVREKHLCNPVAVDDAPALDPATHLACYTVRPVPGQRPVTPPNLTIENRFGEQTIRFLGSSNDRTLCVPAEAHLEGDEPAEASFDGESFRCRRVKSLAPKRLTPAPHLVLADELESKLMRVRALDSLCTPVGVDSEEIPSSRSSLACYTLSQAPGQQAFRPPGTIELTSELGEQTLTVRNAQRMLCVPTERR